MAGLAPPPGSATAHTHTHTHTYTHTHAHTQAHTPADRPKLTNQRGRNKHNATSSSSCNRSCSSNTSNTNRSTTVGGRLSPRPASSQDRHSHIETIALSQHSGRDLRKVRAAEPPLHKQDPILVGPSRATANTIEE